MFRIGRQHLRNFRPGFVEPPGRFVESAKMEVDIHIIGRNLFQILVRLDRFAVVIRNFRVVCLNQISFRCRKLVAQIHGFPGKLLSLIIISEIAISLRQFGISQREPGILLDRSLKTLCGFEMISLARQLNPFVVAPQGLQRIGRWLKRFGSQFLQHIGGQGKVLLDGHRELRNRGQQCFFVRCLRFHGNRTLMLQVTNRGVDTDLIAEFRVLSPNQRVGIAELRNASHRCGIDGRARRDLQVRQHLMQAVGRDRAQVCGLADVRAQYVGQARSQPIESSIPRAIAERQNRQRYLRPGRCLAPFGRELATERPSSDRYGCNQRTCGDPLPR